MEIGEMVSMPSVTNIGSTLKSQTTRRAKPILTPIVRAIVDVDREGFGAMVLRCDLV